MSSIESDLQTCLGLKPCNHSNTLGLITTTESYIERQWKKQRVKKEKVRKSQRKRSNELTCYDTTTITTQRQRPKNSTPFRDMTNQASFDPTTVDLQGAVGTTTEATTHPQNLAAKEKELSMLRAAHDAKCAQYDRLRSQAFVHRLCSILLLTLEVGTEVLIESLSESSGSRLGKVVKSNSRYNNTSLYWSLVSSIGLSMTIQFEEDETTMEAEVGYRSIEFRCSRHCVSMNRDEENSRITNSIGFGTSY